MPRPVTAARSRLRRPARARGRAPREPGAARARSRSGQAAAGRARPVEAGGLDTAAERAAAAVRAHCVALVDAAAPACVGVKLQLACFERLGAPGWAALADVAAPARGPRACSCSPTASGATCPTPPRPTRRRCSGATETPWGPVEGLGADAVTANPLLGRDSLEPIVTAARARGAGRVRAGADLEPGRGRAAGRRTGRRAAAARAAGRDRGRARARRRRATPGCPTSARWWRRPQPALMADLRARMPHAVFLLPGHRGTGRPRRGRRARVRRPPCRGARDRLAVDRRRGARGRVRGGRAARRGAPARDRLGDLRLTHGRACRLPGRRHATETAWARVSSPRAWAPNAKAPSGCSPPPRWRCSRSSSWSSSSPRWAAGTADSSTSSERPAAASERRARRANATGHATREQRGSPRFYVVKPGDNLAAIAQETGVLARGAAVAEPGARPAGAGRRVSA